VITGHLGIAGIVRGMSRAKMSTALFVAFALSAFAPDILDGLYFAFGICSPYGLYSHTVHAVVLEAAVIGGAVFLWTGSRVTALTFAVIVLLHVPADWFTGRKLLLPGGEMAGLYWYDRPLYDFLLEVPTVLLGWWFLRRSGVAPRWSTSKWVLALALAVQAAFNIAAARSPGGIKPNGCFSDADATPSLVGGR
jgi:hypothetical protein